MDRRQFIGNSAQAVAIAACGGLAWYALLVQQARASGPLRPPGAREGAEFAGVCIRCGQCVRACPYHTLTLASAAEAGGAGMPRFVPREVPCYMCEKMPCVRACPTGALDPGLRSIADARMGIAVIDQESCLSWQGLRCEVCYRACPVRGKAITISTHPREISRHAVFVPVLHSDACTGCGVCEKKCPTEIAAIRIVDRKRVLGRMGDHYRVQRDTEEQARELPSGPTSAPEPARTSQPASPAALDYFNRQDAP